MLLHLAAVDAKCEPPNMYVLFRHGMTGIWASFPSASELPKHSHFMIEAEDKTVIAHVDQRRFGTWEVVPSEQWGDNRGPDPIYEYEAFRKHVLSSLEKNAFQHPICEVLLDQDYFNGIGNYLRAEILHRADVRPFERAKNVLEKLPLEDDGCNPKDILRLCKVIPEEAIQLEFSYGAAEDKEKAFEEWLQCYQKDGASSCKDSGKRMIWWFGSAGPLLPAGTEVRHGAKGTGRKGKLIPNEDGDEAEAKGKGSKGKKPAAKAKVKKEQEQEEEDEVEEVKPAVQKKGRGRTAAGTSEEFPLADARVRRSARSAQKHLDEVGDGQMTDVILENLNHEQEAENAVAPAAKRRRTRK
jgi:endonuclease VIII-like 1